MTHGVLYVHGSHRLVTEGRTTRCGSCLAQVEPYLSRPCPMLPDLSRPCPMLPDRVMSPALVVLASACAVSVGAAIVAVVATVLGVIR